MLSLVYNPIFGLPVQRTRAVTRTGVVLARPSMHATSQPPAKEAMRSSPYR